MDNVELLKHVYANFATGNIPAVLSSFDPAIEWYECKGMPFIKGDGHFSGCDEIVQAVFMQLPENIDGFNTFINDIFGAGDRIVMEGYYQGAYKKTSKAFKANATHVWTAKDGKLVRFFQAVDTAEIIG